MPKGVYPRKPCSPGLRAKRRVNMLGNRYAPQLPIGTRTTNVRGYVLVKVATPRAWKYEHRLVYEAANGPLPDGSLVHHINGDRTDNRLENLKPMSLTEHQRLHNAKD